MTQTQVQQRVVAPEPERELTNDSIDIDSLLGILSPDLGETPARVITASYIDQFLGLDSLAEILPWFLLTRSPGQNMSVAMGVLKWLKQRYKLNDPKNRVLIVGEKKAPWMGVFLAHMTKANIFSLLPADSKGCQYNTAKIARLTVVPFSTDNEEAMAYRVKSIATVDSQVLIINLDSYLGNDSPLDQTIYQYLPDRKIGLLTVTSENSQAYLLERFRLNVSPEQAKLYPRVEDRDGIRTLVKAYTLPYLTQRTGESQTIADLDKGLMMQSKPETIKTFSIRFPTEEVVDPLILSDMQVLKYYSRIFTRRHIG